MAASAMAAGVARERIWLDPGLGFGKSAAHNLALTADLGHLIASDFLGRHAHGLYRMASVLAEEYTNDDVTVDVSPSRVTLSARGTPGPRFVDGRSTDTGRRGTLRRTGSRAVRRHSLRSAERIRDRRVPFVDLRFDTRPDHPLGTLHSFVE